MLVDEVAAVLSYSRSLVRFGSEDDLVAGLGMVTLHGGQLDQEGRARDLKVCISVWGWGACISRAGGQQARRGSGVWPVGAGACTRGLG